MPLVTPDHDRSPFAILPHPAIIAHRGSSAYAPENTIAAFELAIQQGADAIELDVWLTRDEQVVVIHGPDLNRTTGVAGSVMTMNLPQLKALDAGSYFDPAYKDERIPTLSEVFEAIGKKIVINIELKNYTSFSNALPDKVTEIVKKHRLGQWVFFSSFNPIAFRHIRSRLPETPTALLALSGFKGWLSRSQVAQIFPYEALHPYYEDVKPSLVKWLHKRNKRLHTYTVNQADDMKKLVELQVDGLITNDPLLARRVISDYRHN